MTGHRELNLRLSSMPKPAATCLLSWELALKGGCAAKLPRAFLFDRRWATHMKDSRLRGAPLFPWILTHGSKVGNLLQRGNRTGMATTPPKPSLLCGEKKSRKTRNRVWPPISGIQTLFLLIVGGGDPSTSTCDNPVPRVEKTT